MGIKDRLDQDLKQALLKGQKQEVSTLRGLKSTVLNEEIARNARDTGLGDEVVLGLLKKEAKKRQEAAELYKQAGENERAAQELAEKELIESYLPAPLSLEQIDKLIDEAIERTGGLDNQTMGVIIGYVKGKAGATADGALIAARVKERL